MPNSRLTIARLGFPRYIDAMAELAGSDKNYAWFDIQAEKLDTKPPTITKKEIYDAMGVSAVTLDKYLTLRKIERVQRKGSE